MVINHAHTNPFARVNRNILHLPVPVRTDTIYCTQYYCTTVYAPAKCKLNLSRRKPPSQSYRCLVPHLLTSHDLTAVTARIKSEKMYFIYVSDRSRTNLWYYDLTRTITEYVRGGGKG